MIFLELQCEPSSAHPDAHDIGGAYVNCWINLGSLDEAEDRAREVLSDDLWVVSKVKQRNVVDSGRAGAADEYVQQALVDGEVFVFHTWPAGQAEDE